MSELENEIKSDKEFIEKVADRIYKDTDDWEETIAEPEWIDRMTEIADRYIERFEVTRKLADKWLQSKQVELNDNQQIVLASLKNNAEQYALRINPIACMTHLHIDSLEGGSTSAQEAYISLSDGEEAQVIEVFAKWVQEQEED